jgi:beta-phosphoglucomutase-like phosphatase (HAD superfamily)
MPGVAVTLALAKGWLGDDVEWLLPDLMEAYKHKAGREYIPTNVGEITERLQRLGRFFEGRPAKVAVVTSSILFEAHIVMTEVFRILATTVAQWPDRVRKKDLILERYTDYRNVYDAFVTATDSSEIRLKPHRDLYSIALRQLGISPDSFNTVVGFEDSESGTLAIRAAGIGLCVAVPFAHTSGHNLEAASYNLRGGLPETLLGHNLFLDHNTEI